MFTTTNNKEQIDKTALMIALENEKFSQALALIKSEKDIGVNQLDQKGTTAFDKLQNALLLGKGDAKLGFELFLLIIQKGLDINYRDTNGATYLYKTIHQVNQDRNFINTALSSIKQLQTLLENKADPNLADNNKVTPLMLCSEEKEAFYSNLDYCFKATIIKLMKLLGYGANLLLQDSKEHKASDYAMRAENFDIALVLKYLEHNPIAITIAETTLDQKCVTLFESLLKKAKEHTCCNVILLKAKEALKNKLILMDKAQTPADQQIELKNEIKKLFKILFDSEFSVEAMNFKRGAIPELGSRISSQVKEQKSIFAILSESQKALQIQQSETIKLQDQIRLHEDEAQKLRSALQDELKKNEEIAKLQQQDLRHEEKEKQLESKVSDLEKQLQAQNEKNVTERSEKTAELENIRAEYIKLKALLQDVQTKESKNSESLTKEKQEVWKLLVEIINDDIYWITKAVCSSRPPKGIMSMQKILKKYENASNAEAIILSEIQEMLKHKKPVYKNEASFFIAFSKRSPITDSFYRILKNVSSLDQLTLVHLNEIQIDRKLLKRNTSLSLS